LLRFISIQFLLDNPKIYDFLDDAVLAKIKPLRGKLSEKLNNSIRDVIQNTRNIYIDNLLKDTVEYPKEDKQYFTNRVDRILTNKYLGIPIFLGIMWLIFHITFTWVGTPVSDALDEFLGGSFTDAVSNLIDKIGIVDFLQDLITDGIIAGVGAVLVFVPQIMVLFFFISLLEDSGYMARIATLMDRIMEYFGLSGKSFIPMIIGFGCNVTGIMTARTIEQPKERLITTLIMPFMSCSARLPIYSLFVAAFFPRHQALIVLSVYFLGIVVALAMAKFYQVIFKVKESSVFVVELPHYHLPRLDVIWHGTWDKGKGFIKKAGTIIFAGTVLIWILSSFGPSGFVTNSANSFAAGLGHILVPVFKPIGLDQWQPISALFTGILAKEVITSSMMVMFHTSSKAFLIASLGQFMTPLSAYTLLVFILLYAPCFATLATIKQETGSTKWMLYSVASSLVVAYGLAFIIFQVGRLFIG